MPDNIPPIPEPLLEAARKGKLILFVGAGVPRIAGAPSWGELADEMLKHLCEKGKLGYDEFELLKKFDPKKKISIAKDIGRGEDVKFELKSILQEKTDKPKALELHKNLFSIEVSIVTTNYDDWFIQVAEEEQKISEIPNPEKAKTYESNAKNPRKSFWNKKDFTKEKLLIPGTIIYLHGCLREENELILTTRDYIEHYNDDYVKEFLKDLFQRYSVLFIGYGLEELEIIDFILKANTSENQEKHYLLFSKFDFEEQSFKHISAYYKNQCGVRLESYCINKGGHSQLKNVIEYLVERLRKEVHPANILEDLKIIDEV